MIIVTNTTKITKGNGHKLIERFNKVGKVETMSGFLGLEVLLTHNTVDYDEVTIRTAGMQKKISKVGQRAQHLKMPLHQGGMPDYILDNKIAYTDDVKVVRMPMAAAQ